jgi:hypothetical protein
VTRRIFKAGTLTELREKAGLKLLNKLALRKYRRLIERKGNRDKGTIAVAAVFPGIFRYADDAGLVNANRQGLVKKIKTIGKTVGGNFRVHGREARRTHRARIAAACAQRLRPLMKRLATTGLALHTLTMVAPARPAGTLARPALAVPGIAVRCQNVVSLNPVRALTVLPGETVTLELMDRVPGSAFVAQPAGGQLVPLGAGRWEWKSPAVPGLYPIRLVAADGYKSVTLQAFVIVPFGQLQGGLLNGYRIGRYPDKPLRGLADYRPPTGFVEVTRENENVLVSPHFRLGQFLCKQPAGSRKYVVLNERLLLALEFILERVNEAGLRATTFTIMSGYRTPAYNTSLGNVHYSMHQWGGAADIFIDENGDGVMDDLNGDGRSDMRDAELLYRLIDEAALLPESQGLIGGLGKYRATDAHGPFVHIDVRQGRKARW